MNGANNVIQKFEKLPEENALISDIKLFAISSCWAASNQADIVEIIGFQKLLAEEGKLPAYSPPFVNTLFWSKNSIEFEFISLEAANGPTTSKFYQ